MTEEEKEKFNKLSYTLQIMIAEYESLQRARESVLRINDNRVNFFFTAITVTGVFLTFVFDTIGSRVANITSIALLTLLFLLGIVTFVRITEGHIANLIYVRGMNRIRRYFSEFSPEITNYFILPITDNVPRFYSVSFNTSRFASWLTIAGLIGIVNSAVLSANVLVLITIATKMSLMLIGIVSISTFSLCLLLHSKYQSGKLSKAEKETEVRFP